MIGQDNRRGNSLWLCPVPAVGTFLLTRTWGEDPIEAKVFSAYPYVQPIIMKTPLLAILTFIPCLAFAQSSSSVSTSSTSTTQSSETTHHYSHKSPKQQLAWLTTKLGLNATQQGQISPVLVSKDAQMKTISGNASLTEVQKHDQVSTLFQSSNTQIESFLTPDQVTQFEALHQHHGKVSVQ
jgi:hypothetical protein